MNYAIVGFGCAGYHAARAIREQDPAGDIHVFETTLTPPANPMLTTYYTSDKLPYQGVFPFGTLEEITARLAISMHSGVRVERVMAGERSLLLSSGERPAFDRILIATGARAFLPHLEGLPSQRVFLMRTLEDARKLKERLAAGDVKKAVVAGASMVGIKVAELLLARGVETTLADAAGYLFPLAAFENVGRELERRVAQRGVHFKWNAAISAITRTGTRFDDGSELEADVVCLCIGTRANVELAANTEVADGQGVDIRRGIVVNSRMETSAPGIYAAGDCCEGTNLQSGETMIIGLWANAGCQGETAGLNMAGGRAEYAGSIVHNITHFMDMDFIGLGDNRLDGQVSTFGDLREGLYIQAVTKDGALRCVNILNGGEVGGVLKSRLMKQLGGGDSAISGIQRAVLRRNGLTDELIELLGGTMG